MLCQRWLKQCQRHFPVDRRPSSLYSQLPNFYFTSKVVFLSESGFLPAACCFIDANTAGAFYCFTAVWTNACAVVDKVFAVYATGNFFFTHIPFAPLPKTLCLKLRIKVSEKHPSKNLLLACYFIRTTH
jgi:hypothetical protein